MRLETVCVQDTFWQIQSHMYAEQKQLGAVIKGAAKQSRINAITELTDNNKD